jgi:acid phosphatase
MLRLAKIAWMSATCGNALASVPDHVVIVIEENRSVSQIMGYPGASFLNQIAAGGALFTDFYALTHPSQPNYIHFFSGDSLGVLDNEVPAGVPFNVPNLASAISAAGRTFTHYSEDLPFTGFDGPTFGAYASKHNAAVHWQSPSPGIYQLPLEANKPFSDFPADFSRLPTISIVIPNLNNDMHDGTVEQGDAWLAQHIGPYAQWAMTHNSLLVITWDEDEFEQRNRIPTILYGPMIRPGEYQSTYTLHNLLRTLCDLYGAVPPPVAQKVAPIAGIFHGDPNVRSVSLRRGAGTIVRDTYIDASVPNVARGLSSPMLVTGTPATAQCLVRFETIIGLETGRVPPGAQVLSAKLKLLTGPAANDVTEGSVAAHRMIRSWTESSNWNSMGSGVELNGIEAASTPECVVLPNVSDAWAIFDVTDSVRQMVLYPEFNQGWVITPSDGDGWRVLSSETAQEIDRPTLEITFVQAVCDGDLNGDALVDDLDFIAFAHSYDILLVPPASAFADLNADGTVDDSDFVLFVRAYYDGACD